MVQGRPRMHLDKLSVDDLFGRFYLKVPQASDRDDYYRALFVAERLLRSSEWQSAVTGYYLNTGRGHALRISYFTHDAQAPGAAVEQFVTQTVLKHSQPPDAPGMTTISRQYGGEELRFRRFLCTYAPIGLDIMVADLLHARCLLATFRFQVMLPRKPYRKHFENTFVRHSPFYQGLSRIDRDQFWRDLAHWPNPPQVDWAHMLVNMVLGRDWHMAEFVQPATAWQRTQINALAGKDALGFTIPANWHPYIID